MDDAPLNSPEAGEGQFPCSACGARLQFMPGTTALACPYCGSRNTIAGSGGAIEELDYRAFLTRVAGDEEMLDVQQVPCGRCGARTTIPPEVAASTCPFCGSSLVITTRTVRLIKPRSLLPFKIDQGTAFAHFRQWIQSRWFAPGDLKKYARSEQKLAGVYVPYWTYDTNTTSRYTGQRGDHYYESETYTAQENGRSVTRTRQVRRTRWTHAGGTVRDQFDDVLVAGSKSLPAEYAARLEPWDLESLAPYADDYLSGFRAESYQVGLEEGFELARKIMDGKIRESVCRDIGGDEQRVFSVDTDYADITFKHILLPVWLSAYRLRDKVYRILINARTGEVQGERPYSAWKIAAAVVAGIIVVAIIALIGSQSG